MTRLVSLAVATLGATACCLAPILTQARPQGDILFDHSQHHQELDLACAECHAATESSRATDLILPLKADCLFCHDGDTAPDECALCHRGADAPITYPREARSIIFSHRDHLEQEGVDCLTCHEDMRTAKRAQAGLPGMVLCFSCHDGVRQTIECAACHVRPTAVMQEIHPDGWVEDHRVAANVDASECRACHHTDDRCSLCHQGDNLQAEIHPLDWVFLHPIEARGRVRDCTSCHDTQLFCVACHRDRQVLPVDHQAGDWTERHGEEARFDLETCDACHGGFEPSCFDSGCHEH